MADIILGYQTTGTLGIEDSWAEEADRVKEKL
jgi:hypothetical protein